MSILLQDRTLYKYYPCNIGLCEHDPRCSGLNCQLSLILFTLFLFTSLPSDLFAATCFSSSPSIKRDIDIYEPIQATILSPNQHDMIKRLFKRMTANWSGTASAITCKGTLDAIEEKGTEYNADVEIESMLHDGIKISIQLHSRQERKRKQDTLQLFLSDTRLGITENTAVGDVQILNLTKSFLVYLRKYVVRTVAGGAVAKEEIRSFAIYDHQIMMEYLEYSNGLLAEKMTATLDRK